MTPTTQPEPNPLRPPCPQCGEPVTTDTCEPCRDADYWTDHEHLNPDRIAALIDRVRDTDTHTVTSWYPTTHLSDYNNTDTV